jgi:methyl-accepting chemotaxis protein
MASLGGWLLQLACAGLLIQRWIAGPLDVLVTRVRTLSAHPDRDATPDVLAECIARLDRIAEHHRDVRAALEWATLDASLPVTVDLNDPDRLAPVLHKLLEHLGARFATMSRIEQDQAVPVRDLGLMAGAIAPLVSAAAASGTALGVRMGELVQKAEITTFAIDELSFSIQEIAQTADELAVGVRQGSTSLARMASSIAEVAENVAEADRLAESTAQAAEGGQVATERTIEGIREIAAAMRGVTRVVEDLGRSSAEIGAIVEAIDDIAEQTNLLALNAAIEAARAGESGRGFAVVADEVRKLAERSAKATREISQLIGGIQSEVRAAVDSAVQGDRVIADGTRVVETAASSLRAIVDSSRQVSSLLHHISQATREQSDTAGRVSEEMDRMSPLTQQVKQTTHEQATGIEQVNAAIGGINAMAAEIQSELALLDTTQARALETCASLAPVSARVREGHVARSQALAPASQQGLMLVG